MDRYLVMTRCGTNFTSTNKNGALMSDLDRLKDYLKDGEHVDDVSEISVHRFTQRSFRNSSMSPRQDLMDKIVSQGISNRPKPIGSTSTNAY